MGQAVVTARRTLGWLPRALTGPLLPAFQTVGAGVGGDLFSVLSVGEGARVARRPLSPGRARWRTDVGDLRHGLAAQVGRAVGRGILIAMANRGLEAERRDPVDAGANTESGGLVRHDVASAVDDAWTMCGGVGDARRRRDRADGCVAERLADLAAASPDAPDESAFSGTGRAPLRLVFAELLTATILPVVAVYRNRRNRWSRLGRHSMPTASGHGLGGQQGRAPRPALRQRRGGRCARRECVRPWAGVARAVTSTRLMQHLRVGPRRKIAGDRIGSPLAGTRRRAARVEPCV